MLEEWGFQILKFQSFILTIRGGGMQLVRDTM